MEHITPRAASLVLHTLATIFISILPFSPSLFANRNHPNRFNLFFRGSDSTFTFQFDSTNSRDQFAAPPSGNLRSRGWDHYRNPSNTNSLQPRYFINPSELTESRILELPFIEQQQLLSELRLQKERAQLAKNVRAETVKVLSSDDQTALRKAGKCPCGRTRADGCKNRSAEERHHQRVQQQRDMREQNTVRTFSEACKDIHMLQSSKQQCQLLQTLHQEIVFFAESTQDSARKIMLYEAAQFVHDACNAVKNNDYDTYDRIHSRLNAALQAAQDPQISHANHYDIADHVRVIAPVCLDLKQFELCVGNTLQHKLHGESVDILHRTSEWYVEHNYLSEARTIAELILLSTDVARTACQEKQYRMSTGFLDIAWAGTKGFATGGWNVLKASFHPKNLAVATAIGLGMRSIALLCSMHPATAIAFTAITLIASAASHAESFQESKKRVQHLLDSKDPKEFIAGIAQLTAETIAAPLIINSSLKLSKAAFPKIGLPHWAISTENKKSNNLVTISTPNTTLTQPLSNQSSQVITTIGTQVNSWFTELHQRGCKNLREALETMWSNPDKYPLQHMDLDSVKHYVRLRGKVERNLRHGFVGEKNQKNKLVGFHVAGGYKDRITKVLKPPDKYGTYFAEYSYDGKTKKSTFFSDALNRVEIIGLYDEAFANPIKFSSNFFVGEAKNGIQIQFYFAENHLLQKWYINSWHALHESDRIQL